MTITYGQWMDFCTQYRLSPYAVPNGWSVLAPEVKDF